MNAIELKNYLMKMFIERIENNTLINIHTCFYMAVIEKIMEYYMTVSDYYEENAIETFELFLNKGILKFKKEA